ncbi:hypothetical protein ACFQFH_08380 [Halobaculum halobium]|uniref:t-SNARE coiled-coil homology domain-containing protein n=1 Tax=Halobaculum halobium TaxID=3032281 RepID=A0ABD5T967_9EURY|nr:hypothetical protein [Halobaculum sp. SYNS20]
MSQGPDATGAVTVEGDGVTVEKRFTADEFPVPAIEFTLRSDREDPTEFRLVDEIPEDFPMDRIGFHPEFESEHWTAYQDHRVEYRRRLDAGEEVTTVYGIRSDDPEDGARFLGEPTVDEVSEDDDPVGDVADVIGDDSSQAVRDVLAGGDAGEPAESSAADDENDGLDLAGAEADLGVDDETDPLAEGTSDDDLSPKDERMESEDASDVLGDLRVGEEGDDGLDVEEAGAEASASEGAEEDLEPEPESEREDDGPDELLELDDEAGGEEDAIDSEQPEAAVDDAEESVVENDDAEDSAAEDDAEDDRSAAGAAASGVAAGGVAAALAEELRAGDVSDEDRELLKEELELDHSTSVDARISRLQSKVEDMAAYSAAMEEFIDENGLASEWMDGLQADLDDLTADIAETREELDEAADDRASIRDEVEAVGEDAASASEDARAATEEVEDLWVDVDELRDDVGDLDEEVADTADSLESSLEEVRADLDDLAEEVADEDEAVAEVREEVASIGEEVESVSALVDDELSEMHTELEAVHDDLAEFEEFRTRLSSVFGPGGTAGGAAAGNDDGASDGGDGADANEE